MNIKKTATLFAAFGLCAAVSAPPVAAQADFTKIVLIGDSVTAGFLDGCLVKYGQNDSYGLILARQTKTADFQQPTIDVPGLGGCRKLTSLAPTFEIKPSTGKPLNLTLARPYDNLAIPGYKIGEVPTVVSSQQNGNPLTDLVLRGLNGGTTMLQQAASAKPTFAIIFIGNNDTLGAGTSGTVIDGVTLTTKASFDAAFKTIAETMKASQGGTGKGVVITLPDITALPFFTAVSPIIAKDPSGNPITVLGSKDNKPVPVNSLLTLLAGSYMAAGYGIPCAVLDAGGVPANDPRRLNCNKPLQDSANPVLGTPGVILYPEEITLIKNRNAEFNATIKSLGEANGYKVFDANAWFNKVAQPVTAGGGVNYGGVTFTTAFLSGGVFSYDGIHPSATGYAVMADELVKFINATYGTSVPRVPMASYVFNGNSQAGGYPATVGYDLSPEELIKYAAEIFTPESYSELRTVFPVDLDKLVPVAEPGRGDVSVSGDRPSSGRVVIKPQ